MTKKNNRSAAESMQHKVKSDAAKKIRSRDKQDTMIFGLGLFGIVGWSIVVPTIMGIALGIYLDNIMQLDFSWTLSLLFAGVIVGCINAWYWVQQKSSDS